MIKLFIYGTLKSEYNNNHILKRAEGSLVSKEVQTKFKYPMYKLSEPFPYLQDSKGSGEHIIGEIWEVQKENMHILDSFEGVPWLYKRGSIEIEGYEMIDCYFKTNPINIENVDLISKW